MMLWAPLVHGRTEHLDFRSRFLASPEDFTDAEVSWSKSFILKTTNQAENLRDGRLRWSMFHRKAHLVVGVTCMARELSDDCVADIYGRPLFVFVGYVARGPWKDLKLPAMDKASFAPLYQFVRDRFTEVGIRNMDRQVKVPYTHCVVEGDESSSLSLNRQGGLTYVWPKSLRTEVWASSAAFLDGVSVLTDVDVGSAWMQGPFTNIVSFGTEDSGSTSWDDIQKGKGGADVENRDGVDAVKRFKGLTTVQDNQADETSSADVVRIAANRGKALGLGFRSFLKRLGL